MAREATSLAIQFAQAFGKHNFDAAGAGIDVHANSCARGISSSPWGESTTRIGVPAVPSPGELHVR